ncbi:hypothetical protein BVJ53_04530 [Lacticaseibacillus chiayiensis]|uniref:Uncharacterized protein n=1 Tax=Lacticaseibacillus chiayiensis TaxID=2100821 RepID=A0A4Q1U7Y9_9LACO|nr:hypothetical protein BVJ53_04530 [Lacticaseibacillus chiayiensis]RXT56830.1 hypothetical protein CHT97_10725 [Lacticaseibacillus chiayiensis]
MTGPVNAFMRAAEKISNLKCDGARLRPLRQRLLNANSCASSFFALHYPKLLVIRLNKKIKNKFQQFLSMQCTQNMLI